MNKILASILLLSAFSLLACKSSSVKDIDGHVYESIVVNKTRWMTKNLNTFSQNSECAGSLIDLRSCDDLGRLYPDDEAQLACPNGWRLPTKDDWEELFVYASSKELWKGKENLIQDARNLLMHDIPHWPASERESQIEEIKTSDYTFIPEEEHHSYRINSLTGIILYMALASKDFVLDLDSACNLLWTVEGFQNLSKSAREYGLETIKKYGLVAVDLKPQDFIGFNMKATPFVIKGKRHNGSCPALSFWTADGIVSLEPEQYFRMEIVPYKKSQQIKSPIRCVTDL